MKKIVKLVGVMLAFVVLAFIANPQSAQAAHNNYRVKTLKTYKNASSYTPDVAFHAKAKTKASVWTNQEFDKSIKANAFYKKGYKLANHKTTTWFVEKKVRIYHKLKSATYYYVANRTGHMQGYVRTNALTHGFSPYGYQIISTKWYNKHDYFHVQDSYKAKNVYAWNYAHTKKRANLKDYPGAVFSKTQTVVMRHNGKDTKYVYLSGTLNGTTKSTMGYVAESAITGGLNPDHTGMNYVYPGYFVNNTDFNQYLQTGKNQKLAREIIKLFPNSQPDLGLSKIAAFNYDSFNNDVDGDPNPVSTAGYTDIKAFPTIQKWLYANHKASNATKIAGVKQLLDKEGYTASKRASMSDYKLGIQIVNNIVMPRGEAADLANSYGYVFILGRIAD